MWVYVGKYILLFLHILTANFRPLHFYLPCKLIGFGSTHMLRGERDPSQHSDSCCRLVTIIHLTFYVNKLKNPSKGSNNNWKKYINASTSKNLPPSWRQRKLQSPWPVCWFTYIPWESKWKYQKRRMFFCSSSVCWCKSFVEAATEISQTSIHIRKFTFVCFTWITTFILLKPQKVWCSIHARLSKVLHCSRFVTL